MTHGSFEDAVRVLRTSVGGRWDGAEADGRDTMVDALKRQLGYSSHQANEVIDAMISSGTLRYHRTNNDNNTDVTDTSSDAVDNGAIAAAAVAGVGLGGATGTASQGGAPLAAPLALGALMGSGYWQVGASDGDDNTMGEKAPMEGRAGQIDPTS